MVKIDREAFEVTKTMIDVGLEIYHELKSGDDYWLANNSEEDEKEGIRKIYLAMAAAKD